MANEVKYDNVDWGEDYPIAGERLATNSHYTGEQLGTPTQSNGETEINTNGHYVEEQIVRLGTLAQDAGDDNFPVLSK